MFRWQIVGHPSSLWTVADQHRTLSGIPVDPVYGEGPLPGEYPYTRGIHASGYGGKLWTMRQFAGFATAEETNQRYKYLLDHGTTGLSVAFDFPTLMGYDSDHPRSLGEGGGCGVAISSLADMETLFEGIPLDRVSVSMTINPISVIECLVDDYGWEFVIDGLMEMAATASDERLDELSDLLDAAIAVNEGKGQLFTL